MSAPRIALDAFLRRPGETRISPLGNGLIHETFLAETSQGDFVLQRFNDSVFQDPELVMANIAEVQSRPALESVLQLRFRPPLEEPDTLLWRNPNDDSRWRCSNFLADTETYDAPPEPRFLEAAAIAFAKFSRGLEGEPLEKFHPPISRFHHTPWRFEQMLAAQEEAEARRKCPETFDCLLQLAGDGFPALGLNGLHPTAVPWGIVHNDTKLNNCLFRKNEPTVVSVIDLDTVMPGTWLMDYGDLVRTSAATAPEDSPDLDRVGLDEARFRAVSKGYLAVYGQRLSSRERARLVYACFLMTLELSFRFFTDHLRGDRYFKTERPGHNLDRARAQARLAQRFLEKRSTLEKVLDELLQTKRSVPTGTAQ